MARFVAAFCGAALIAATGAVARPLLLSTKTSSSKQTKPLPFAHDTALPTTLLQMQTALGSGTTAPTGAAWFENTPTEEVCPYLCGGVCKAENVKDPETGAEVEPPQLQKFQTHTGTRDTCENCQWNCRAWKACVNADPWDGGQGCFDTKTVS